MNSSVGAASRESSMDRVERNVVHGIHQRLVFCIWGLISAVAFERKVVCVILFLDVLYGHATFNTADCEATTWGVGKARYYTRLPLQGRCYGLVGCGGVSQVEYLNMTLRGAKTRRGYCTSMV